MMGALASLNDRASTVPWWLLLPEGLAALVFAALLLVAQKQPLNLTVQVAGILAIIAGNLMVQHASWSGSLIPATASLWVGLLGIAIVLIGMGQAMAGGGWHYGVLGFLCVILGIPFLFNSTLDALVVPVVPGIAFLTSRLGAIYLSLGLRKDQVAADT
jgi:uncharacterized membrane protein HdeD (DUF308 family)